MAAPSFLEWQRGVLCPPKAEVCKPWGGSRRSPVGEDRLPVVRGTLQGCSQTGLQSAQLPWFQFPDGEGEPTPRFVPYVPVGSVTMRCSVPGFAQMSLLQCLMVFLAFGGSKPWGARRAPAPGPELSQAHPGCTLLAGVQILGEDGAVILDGFEPPH